MGTWGTGIFENDTAGDLRDAFEDEISTGADVATATKHVLAKFGDDLEDTADGPVIYLALAHLQSEYGIPQQSIREHALKIIDTEEGLGSWADGGPFLLLERKRVLEELRTRLTS